MTLAKNERGRDFVVGDIHGMFDLLNRALERAMFDPETDRLISVGDLVNRGPQSLLCLEYLAQDWFYAVRGNHEDKILKAVAENGRLTGAKSAFDMRACGMDWLLALPAGVRAKVRREIADMPVAMEIETDEGLAGFVHATVPRSLDWAAFRDKIKKGDPSVTEKALYNRGRIKKMDDCGVDGAWRVFLGHTVQKSVIRLGNCFYTDTGAAHGFMKGTPESHYLTLADIKASDQALTAPKPANSDVHVILNEKPRFKRFFGQLAAKNENCQPRRNKNSVLLDPLGSNR